MASNQAEGASLTGSPNPIFPLARFCYQGPLRHYYPFGNVPAEDFLEHCIKASYPSVLVLGCGDMRSCFYTLWKNFDNSISDSHRFEGVRFIINDRSPPIIARNLIFLYMCLQLPEDGNQRTEWLCAMWAIWYCHELYPEHSKLLNSTLKILIKFSASLDKWCSSDNPLHQLVDFESPLCLSEVTEVWKMWFSKSVQVDSVKSMHESRKNKWKKHCMDAKALKTEYVFKNLDVFGGSEKEVLLKAVSRIKEMHSYFNIGNCFAEEIMGTSLSKTSTTEVNITMYETKEGRYCCHYALIPFQCYHHTADFYKESIGLNKSESVSDITVPTESFKSKPYLSNSFQQFAIWIQTSSQVLKNKKVSVLFMFDCRDAITFCQQKYHWNSDLSNTLYDIITTSNLVDHVGLPNLVLSCVPLLTTDGLLVTSTLKMRAAGISGEDFLKMSFGFDSEILPIFLGVHCTSYDGDYSNSVFMKAAPPDLTHSSLFQVTSVRSFLWTKVHSPQKIVLSQLPQRSSGNLTDAVIKACTSCSYSMLNCGLLTFISTGIETAMAMLKCLISHCDDSVRNYSYWEPVCIALRTTAKPYLYCLQTQMLVHGIHTHLVLDEETCPICTQKPLNQILGLFCLKLDLTCYEDASFNFIAYLHKAKFSDSNDLHRKAEEGEDVYIFDSFDVVTNDRFNLQLKFFAPLIFTEKKNFNITLAIVQKTNFLNKVAVLHTTALHSLQSNWEEYDFYPINTQIAESANDSFGKVTSHIIACSQTETKLALSKAMLQCLSASKLTIEKISYNIINICCGSMKFQIILPFPVNYNKINLKVSRSVGHMIITCPRQPFILKDERPCFIINPDHPSFKLMKPNKELLMYQSEIQFSQDEKDYLKRTPFHQRRDLPKIDAKCCLEELFDNVSNGRLLYGIYTNKLCCIILVNEILFDYNNRTPALDLAFCTLQNCDESVLQRSWMKLLKLFEGMKMMLTKKGGDFLQETLKFFAERTYGTLRKKKQYAFLYKHNLDSIFTRAAVYYLSIDPDTRQWVPKPRFDPTHIKAKCANCSQTSSNFRLCEHCNCIQYCTYTCQILHYNSEHKKLCEFITQGKYTPFVHIPHNTIHVSSIKIV